MDDFQKSKLRFLQLNTPHFCDGAPKLIHLLDPRIRPLLAGTMVGIAHTIESQGNILPVLKALHEAKKGEILVISSGGSLKALAGELMTTEAKRKGLAGIVIDGACRDVDGIRMLRLPFYARSISAEAGARIAVGQTQVPIICGGVTIHPGDILFGDEDGLVAIRPSEWQEALLLAEEVRKKEETVMQRIHSGDSLMDIFAAIPEKNLP